MENTKAKNNLMTSEINSRAWEMRREAAEKQGCKIMTVSWKDCYRQAREELAETPYTQIEDLPVVSTVLEGIGNGVIATGHCFAFIFLMALSGLALEGGCSILEHWSLIDSCTIYPCLSVPVFFLSFIFSVMSFGVITDFLETLEK